MNRNKNGIKLAYDWIGPTRAYTNNQSFAGNIPLKNLRSNELMQQLFEKVQGYYPTPSLLISDEDIFIYEYAMSFDENSWFSHTQADLLSTSGILPNILSKIKNGGGYILLELGQEGIYNTFIIKVLHDFFKKAYIPLNKVIFQVGNPGAKEIYNTYCDEKNIPYGNVTKRNIFLIQCEFCETLNPYQYP